MKWSASPPPHRSVCRLMKKLNLLPSFSLGQSGSPLHSISCRSYFISHGSISLALSADSISERKRYPMLHRLLRGMLMKPSTCKNLKRDKQTFNVPHVKLISLFMCNFTTLFTFTAHFSRSEQKLEMGLQQLLLWLPPAWT